MRVGAIAIFAWMLSATLAVACICDLECPDGEVYSDEAEMCVAQEAPTS